MTTIAQFSYEIPHANLSTLLNPLNVYRSADVWNKKKYLHGINTRFVSKTLHISPRLTIPGITQRQEFFMTRYIMT